MAARFIISAARPEQFPPEAEPEVAFLGRSNVGKSSLLNALVGAGMVGTEKVARISSRPGCTQSINFYQVDGGYRFVDLPGYGYAKVPREISRPWKQLIEEEFGDGIMSAIDFDFLMERVANPKGDRVKITMSGKFLPYKYYGNDDDTPEYGYKEP